MGVMELMGFMESIKIKTKGGLRAAAPHAISLLNIRNQSTNHLKIFPVLR